MQVWCVRTREGGGGAATLARRARGIERQGSFAGGAPARERARRRCELVIAFAREKDAWRRSDRGWGRQRPRRGPGECEDGRGAGRRSGDVEPVHAERKREKRGEMRRERRTSGVSREKTGGGRAAASCARREVLRRPWAARPDRGGRGRRAKEGRRAGREACARGQPPRRVLAGASLAAGRRI